MSVINGKNIQILKRFSEQANRLCVERYRSLLKQKVNISYEEGRQVEVKNEFPDEDLVKTFLMDLRFFLIKDKNPYNFEAVCELCVENNIYRDKTTEWLNVYREIFKNESVRISINDSDLSTNSIFHTILNEEHFHQEKRGRGMERITAHPVTEGLARMKFLKTIGNILTIICSFNKQVVEEYLKNNNNEVHT